MQITAHEIGHLLVGYGHPDDKRKNVTKGPAPLPDTNHKERLMHSGEGTSVAYGATVITAYRSHRLVKGEWDEAELWLNTNIKDPTE